MFKFDFVTILKFFAKRNQMKTIAISIGDINGIGLEIALKAHNKIKSFCNPLYFINLLSRGAKILNTTIPDDFKLYECGSELKIKPGKISKKSGKFSFLSFENALIATQKGRADALVTLPINKKAWSKAGIKYVGHTDALSDFFKKQAIMMLGCDELFCALFTDHIALKDVSKHIKSKALSNFLLDFYKSSKFNKIGVLGLNPHAGDGGVLGNEEKAIKKAIKKANEKLKEEIFIGPLVSDAAFNENSLRNCNRIVAMYHDQGLAPLKALYFDKAINVSLNLPIIRTSVDHGTAYNIAYRGLASTKSYIEAVKYADFMAKNSKISANNKACASK